MARGQLDRTRVEHPARFYHGYQSYEGAYGKTGAAAETAYLDRTAYWADRFEQQRAEARSAD